MTNRTDWNRSGTGRAKFNMEVGIATFLTLSMIEDENEEIEDGSIDLIPVFPLLSFLTYAKYLILQMHCIKLVKQ